MNKKDILKILLIIVLIAAIGYEGYFYFKNHDLENIIPEEETAVVVKKEDMKQYIIDITKPYYKNGVKVNLTGDNYFYHQISGLKNKDIENKVNELIKTRTNKVYENNNDKKLVSTQIQANYSNILSLVIFAVPVENSSDISLKKAKEYEEYYVDQMLVDTLNVDLTTGLEFTIDNVVTDRTLFREKLVKNAEESITKGIGFVCDGGPCENPEPDYSTVEDSTLSIINQFNKDNFLFYISPQDITLFFKDVYIIYAEEYFEFDDYDYSHCKVYVESYGDDDEEESYNRYICQNEIKTTYDTYIKFIDIYDMVTIYNRFETSESIYENERIKEPLVFYSTDSTYNGYVNILEETDNGLIDFTFGTYFEDVDEKLFDKVRKEVLDESQKLQTDNMNYYNYYGQTSYLGTKYTYVFFNVYHYDIPPDIYQELKPDIYLANYHKLEYQEDSETVFNENAYKFLKKYLTKKAYYFYIYDDKGHEVSCRSILNPDFNYMLYIPESWLNIGKYKNITDLVNSAYLMVNEDATFKDRLVIEDKDMTIIFRYQNKSVKICDTYDECSSIRENLYR